MGSHLLDGSSRDPVPGAKAAGPWEPSAQLRVTLILRRRSGDTFRAHVRKIEHGDVPLFQQREELAKQFGADPQDLAAVRAFAQKNGLEVVQEDAARRTVVVSGTVKQFNDLFAVDLQRYECEKFSYRGRVGPIYLPDELRGIVEAVLGLDDRPQAKPHFRPAAAPSTSFNPLELAALYDFPEGNGQGQCIGIIELGGGFATADLQAYFGGLGLAVPTVVAVPVDGASNAPTGDSNGPDGEVMLDIEVAGALAPAARIAVYFAPNTDAGFLDAITTAIHDTTNRPSVISISWGGPESDWTQQAMTNMDEAFQAAAMVGVTICAASGDNGSNDGVSDGKDHVDFPASSSYVLACGGTSLKGSAQHIASENVWNNGAAGGATGGGVSAVFPLPAWQKGLATTDASGKATPLPRRGVPDVAGDADPETGYAVRVDGQDVVYGGTSAVAPLWSGLIARLNALRGSSLGYINPKLYASAASMNDITQGTNGDFAASKGWDACTGLGSPNGVKLASSL